MPAGRQGFKREREMHIRPHQNGRQPPSVSAKFYLNSRRKGRTDGASRRDPINCEGNVNADLIFFTQTDGQPDDCSQARGNKDNMEIAPLHQDSGGAGETGALRFMMRCTAGRRVTPTRTRIADSPQPMFDRVQPIPYQGGSNENTTS